MRKVLILMAALLAPVPAAAGVDAVSDAGFVSRHEVTVAPKPARAWQTMLLPAQWWNGAHTYSGDAAFLSIEPRAGGCFCERIPGKNGVADGTIEHMRVLYTAPGKTLRMTGGLGPLQGEAVTGVLTITLEEDAGGTRIAWEYVVGGYSVASLRELAPLVDKVMGEQLGRLKAQIETN